MNVHGTLPQATRFGRHTSTEDFTAAGNSSFTTHSLSRTRSMPSMARPEYSANPTRNGPSLPSLNQVARAVWKRSETPAQANRNPLNTARVSQSSTSGFVFPRSATPEHAKPHKLTLESLPFQLRRRVEFRLASQGSSLIDPSTRYLIEMSERRVAPFAQGSAPALRILNSGGYPGGTPHQDVLFAKSLATTPDERARVDSCVSAMRRDATPAEQNHFFAMMNLRLRTNPFAPPVDNPLSAEPLSRAAAAPTGINGFRKVLQSLFSPNKPNAAGKGARLAPAASGSLPPPPAQVHSQIASTTTDMGPSRLIRMFQDALAGPVASPVQKTVPHDLGQAAQLILNAMHSAVNDFYGPSRPVNIERQAFLSNSEVVPALNRLLAEGRLTPAQAQLFRMAAPRASHAMHIGYQLRDDNVDAMGRVASEVINIYTDPPNSEQEAVERLSQRYRSMRDVDVTPRYACAASGALQHALDVMVEQGFLFGEPAKYAQRAVNIQIEEWMGRGRPVPTAARPQSSSPILPTRSLPARNTTTSYSG